MRKNTGTIEFLRAEVKEGRTWKETYYLDETMEYLENESAKEHIYKCLMHDMIAKKLHKCTYIKSITRSNPYDGTELVTVTYDNDSRRIYKVEF